MATHEPVRVHETVRPHVARHGAGSGLAHARRIDVAVVGTGRTGVAGDPLLVVAGARMDEGGRAPAAAAVGRLVDGDADDGAGEIGRRARPERRISGDYESEEAAERASRICGFGDGRSVEGSEESGEEGVRQ